MRHVQNSYLSYLSVKHFFKDSLTSIVLNPSCATIAGFSRYHKAQIVFSFKQISLFSILTVRVSSFFLTLLMLQEVQKSHSYFLTAQSLAYYFHQQAQSFSSPKCRFFFETMTYFLPLFCSEHLFLNSNFSLFQSRRFSRFSSRKASCFFYAVVSTLWKSGLSFYSHGILTFWGSYFPVLSYHS